MPDAADEIAADEANNASDFDRQVQILDEHSQATSNVNNGGLGAQIAFLVERPGAEAVADELRAVPR